MNLKIVVGAGIISAFLGAALGVVVSYMVGHSRIAQSTPNTRRNALVGAGLGIVVGSGYAALKQEQSDYFGDENEGKKQG